LEAAGFTNICMYERDVSLAARRSGYGMTLTYHPRGILAHLGVLEDLARADCPSRSHYLLSAPQGRVRGYFGNAFGAAQRGVGQRGNLRVPRPVVRQILCRQLRHTKLHWNHALTDVQLASSARTTTSTAADSTTTKQKQEEDDPLVKLHFSNGTTVLADVVVAADGWRSTLLQTCLAPSSRPSQPRPQSLGIYIIVGLARGVPHHLVNQQGFYTLAPGVRLFVMPFADDSTAEATTERVTMWQLSFGQVPTVGGAHAERGGACDDTSSYVRTGAEYWQQAWNMVASWHAPVPSLLQATPPTSVWGTLLHDVDPTAMGQALQSSPYRSRVLAVGDALHAMSPFKGQGANQALRDGAVVADWLSRSASRGAAVKGALREIIQRTAPVVQASREAAAYWHGPQALQSEEHTMAGLSVGSAGDFDKSQPQHSLWEAGITAASTPHLDHEIRRHVQEVYNWEESDPKDDTCEGVKISPELQSLVLQAAREGRLAQLRQCVWENEARLVQSAVDPRSANNCLHEAVLGAMAEGHDLSTHRRHTIQWLVTQAGCNFEHVNHAGQRPMDLTQSGPLQDLLRRLELWQADHLRQP
jgi:2-polyprenyl-6-methoxyphenol hydroxylase-like FAD-dependent oxidoreductase